MENNMENNKNNTALKFTDEQLARIEAATQKLEEAHEAISWVIEFYRRKNDEKIFDKKPSDK